MRMDTFGILSGHRHYPGRGIFFMAYRQGTYTILFPTRCEDSPRARGCVMKKITKKPIQFDSPLSDLILLLPALLLVLIRPHRNP